MHFYLTYKILKFTLKHFFTVTPTCFGPYGPKHVGVTVKTCFNVNFNILYVK